MVRSVGATWRLLPMRLVLHPALGLMTIPSVDHAFWADLFHHSVDLLDYCISPCETRSRLLWSVISDAIWENRL